MRPCTVLDARHWLRDRNWIMDEVVRDGGTPGAEAHWAWQPAEIDMYNNMDDVVHANPGKVCRACWLNWH